MLPTLFEVDTAPTTAVLIDVSNMAYRSAHAGTHFTAPDGTPYGHVLLSCNQIIRLRRLYPKAAFVWCLDHPSGPTARKEIYGAYKANRSSSLNYNPKRGVIKLCSFLKGKTLESEGHEADDVIASFVAQRDNYSQIIVESTDQDLWQLLEDPRVTISTTGGLIGQKEAIEKFGVPPHKIPLHKAIFGDKSDNLPKVPRIRTKPTIKLLRQSESIEDIFEKAADFLSSNEQKKLQNHKKQVAINHILAKLKYDIPLVSKVGTGDREELQRFLTWYNCGPIISNRTKFDLLIGD